jgi:N-acyl-D-amino-acid deacylase
MSRPLMLACIAVLVAAAAALAPGWLPRATLAEDIPTTGRADPAFQSFDDTMLGFMRKRGIPGGALAVLKDGRLVYARGYGWADKEHNVPARPTSLFRLASISKTITSTAVLTLVQDGKLDLDAPAFKLLGLKPYVAPGGAVDPRIWQVTVRELLHHTGGFDSGKSGDPMFMPLKIAQAVGAPPPADQDAIIRYMLGRPLDWDPGTHYAYSNFGYCVLGRVIEKVSGQPYGQYVQQHVLHPLGITHMALGRTLLRDQRPDEVHYYQPNDGLVTPVFPDAKAKQVPEPYGGFNLDAMDSHGGWLASAVDLARFAGELDFPDGKPLLGPAAVRETYARPAPPVSIGPGGQPDPVYYACGWEVRVVGQDGRTNRWHNGSLPGTDTWLIRRWDGLSWVALFNERSEGGMPPDGEIDSALHVAADAVKQWPGRDLFQEYRDDL